MAHLSPYGVWQAGLFLSAVGGNSAVRWKANRMHMQTSAMRNGGSQIHSKVINRYQKVVVWRKIAKEKLGTSFSILILHRTFSLVLQISHLLIEIVHKII